MTDSDNTTTLLPVTGTTSPVIMPNSNCRALTCQTEQYTDPAVAIWLRCQDAQERTERLCRQQQALERKLIEAVGLPCATIQSSDGENVEADFEAHKARWDTADRELGYSATLRAERDAAQRAADLLEVLSRTPATSLAGVAAKLDAVLREGQPSEDDPEFPWPQIRSVLADVVRIGEQTGLGTQA
ncbi:hypothetical protein CK215_30050 [Mesorhizobium sp. WSM3864]|uniref:hypothetical protein n=1 Tax=Mesorhizobium sp. WSM3864 TaxID=2029404 RepID=UPI000BAF3FCA|nr:hypothetical protein [Mesorhizobium sp. WSM3864]PBB88978.1 hypothetical protein CK215_30050 [Mesorhizobium sp. WSM3864]